MAVQQRNLEIKVRVDSLDALRRRARILGARDLGRSHDVDTYFRVPRGRLKLRQHGAAHSGELIFYDRPDNPSSRYSDYEVVPVEQADEVKQILTNALGVLAVVAKTRHLLVYGDTRIHLDRVDGLGSFAELETVLGGQPLAEAHAEHDHIKAALALDAGEPVPCSYSDLVLMRDG